MGRERRLRTAWDFAFTAALITKFLHGQAVIAAASQRLGGDVAVFATARKLATLIYRLQRWGQPYVDEGEAAYENRYRQQRSQRLAATVKQLGFQMAPIDLMST